MHYSFKWQGSCICLSSLESTCWSVGYLLAFAVIANNSKVINKIVLIFEIVFDYEEYLSLLESLINVGFRMSEEVYLNAVKLGKEMIST